MDDFDIYEDLALEEKEIEDSTTISEFKKTIENLENEVKTLGNENKELRKDKLILLTNMSSLMNTAKLEISRHKKKIAQLQKEVDEMTFRRNKHRLPSSNIYQNQKDKKLSNEPVKIENEKFISHTNLNQPTKMSNEYLFADKKCHIKQKEEEEEEDVEQNYNPNQIIDTVYGKRLKEKIEKEIEQEKLCKLKEESIKSKEKSEFLKESLIILADKNQINEIKHRDFDDLEPKRINESLNENTTKNCWRKPQVNRSYESYERSRNRNDKFDTIINHGRYNEYYCSQEMRDYSDDYKARLNKYDKLMDVYNRRNDDTRDYYSSRGDYRSKSRSNSSERSRKNYQSRKKSPDCSNRNSKEMRHSTRIREAKDKRENNPYEISQRRKENMQNKNYLSKETFFENSHKNYSSIYKSPPRRGPRTPPRTRPRARSRSLSPQSPSSKKSKTYSKSPLKKKIKILEKSNKEQSKPSEQVIDKKKLSNKNCQFFDLNPVDANFTLKNPFVKICPMKIEKIEMKDKNEKSRDNERKDKQENKLVDQVTSINFEKKEMNKQVNDKDQDVKMTEEKKKEDQVETAVYTKSNVVTFQVDKSDSKSFSETATPQTEIKASENIHTIIRTKRRIRGKLSDSTTIIVSTPDDN